MSGERPRLLLGGDGGAVLGGVLAGALHALSLRPGRWSLLAWVALVPLLVVAGRGSVRRVVFAALAYTAALLALAVAPWFIATLHVYFQLTPAVAWSIGIVAVALTAAAYGALLAAALALRRRSAPVLGVLWCAALWSVWEPLRTALVPPYFPLAVLATSQASAPSVLQIASVTGIAGVTALLVATNAAIASLWSANISRRRALTTVATVVSLVVAVTLWGMARVARAPSPLATGPRVMVVDGAAPDAATSTLERYIAATVAVADARPSLVVWPESALAADFERDVAAWKRLSEFVDDLGIALVAGGVGSSVTASGDVVRFNSVHFIRPRHGMVSYHKRLLVPFAESWPEILGTPPPAIEPVAAGNEIAVFSDGTAFFGPLICFEITNAASVRELARRDARFVVSVNNDVWFAGWEAPQAVWAQVRAVESGLPVVRAANGGMSAVIDPFGRVLTSMRADGSPALLAGTVPEPVDTIYVRVGDLFLLLCGLLVIGGVVPRRRGPHSNAPSLLMSGSPPRSSHAGSSVFAR